MSTLLVCLVFAVLLGLILIIFKLWIINIIRGGKVSEKNIDDDVEAAQTLKKPLLAPPPQAAEEKCHGMCGCHNVIWDVLAANDLLNMDRVSNIRLSLAENRALGTVVISGGTIRPLINGSMDPVEAIGIHDGKIVACGNLDQVKDAMDGKRYDEIQLKSTECLIPGFIEPHCHPMPTALMQKWVDFSPFIAETQELELAYDEDWLRAKLAASRPKRDSEWILGHGLDPSLMPFHKKSGKDELNRLVRFTTQYLDDMLEECPVLILSASMHTVYVNTKALWATYDRTAALQKEFPEFEEYRRNVDAAGGLQEFDGILPAVMAIPPMQLGEHVEGLFENLAELFQEAATRGITMVYDAGMNPMIYTVMKVYLDSHPFHHHKVKIGGARMVVKDQDAANLPKFNKDDFQSYKPLFVGHVKMVSDGSNQGLTGFQTKPYCCEPKQNTGMFNFGDNGDRHPQSNPHRFENLVQEIIVDKGWSVMIHANGNKAVEFTLEAFEKAIQNCTNIDDDARHRIEHCSLTDESILARMKAVGVHPSFLIGHVGFWGFVFANAIFEDKAKQHLDLCKSALKRGLRLTLHSDNSVTPFGPLRMMEQAVTRTMERDPNLQTLNPDQRLSMEEALRAVTFDAAWQCRAEQFCGSLETGKDADFVILAKDPLQMQQVRHLRQLPIKMTVQQGRVTYTQ